MRHQVSLPRPQAPGLRRAFLMFFTFVYLFIGLTHSTAHTTEVTAHTNGAVSATISFEMSGAVTDGSDDANSKNPSAVAEHCQIYAPTLMPVLAPVAARTVQAVRLSFITPKLLLEDHPWVDTPPPKHLT